MNRSGYSDCLDNWDLIRWRGRVASAIRGKRGQAFLREMLAALDAMPEKRLIAHALKNTDPGLSGIECGVCAIGAVGDARGIDMSEIEPEDRDHIASVFGIAMPMAAEIEFVNDEGGGYWNRETPEERWSRVRAWVVANIKPEPSP